MEGALESGDELAAEHAAEHLDGEKEGAAGGDPAGVVRSEAAGGEHAVDMGMMLQALVPGMEHAEEADLGAEVPGIASDLEQGRGAGVEQQVINQPLVLQGKWGQFAREGEDDMHVAGGEQLALAGFEPAHTGVALTSWAMPITARIVRDGGMSATGALIAMSAQRRGAATGDGQQHLLMLPANPSATALYEVVTSTVNDVGHLQRRSVHALRDTPCPLNLAQRHQGWLNHTRMRPPLSKRLRSSRILSKFTGSASITSRTWSKPRFWAAIANSVSVSALAILH